MSSISKLAAAFLVLGLCLPAAAVQHFTRGGGGTGAAPTLPSISSVLPNGGGLAGGTPVTITGTNLTSGTVKFNGVSATGVSCGSTTCTATSPAGAAATIDVTVTTSAGTNPGTANDDFTYADWVASLTANGYHDVNTNVISFTELRNLVVHEIPSGDLVPESNPTGTEVTCNSSWAQWDGVGCPIAVAGTGNWEDTACGASPGITKPPLVLTLVTPTGQWNQDHILSDAGLKCFYTPGGINSQFMVANALYNLTFSTDSAGAITPVQIIAGAGLGGRIDTRNDATNSWTTGTPGGCSGGTDRSLGTVVDPSNSIEYMLIGNDATGICNGTLNHGSFGFTYSAQAEPWGGGTCRDIARCTNFNSDWGASPTTNSCSDTSLNSATYNSGTGILAITLAAEITGPTTVDSVTLSGVTGTGTAFLNATWGISTISGTTVNLNTATGHGSITPGVGGATMVFPSVVPCSSTPRITGIVSCTDSTGTLNAYAAVLGELWQRNNAGASSNWTLNSVMPNAQVGNSSQTELRGLTCIPNPSGPGHVLLATTEGGLPSSLAVRTANVWRIDPAVGTGVGSSTGWTAETNTTGTPSGLQTVFNTQFGVSGASGSGYQISGYNGGAFQVFNNSLIFDYGTAFMSSAPTGQTLFTVNTGVGSTASLNYLAFFIVRDNSSVGTPTAPVFTMYPLTSSGAGNQYASLKALFSQKIIGTRAVIPSPFPTDINPTTGNTQFMYFGGMDANKTPMTQTGWVVRAPLNMFTIP